MGKLYTTPAHDQVTAYELIDRWGDRYCWIGTNQPLIRFAEEGYYKTGDNEQGHAIFEGLIGPLDGGMLDGIPVMRYEDPNPKPCPYKFRSTPT